MKCVSSFSDVWKHVKKHSLWGLGSTILDGIFFFIFGGFTVVMWSRIMDQTKALMEIIAAETPKLEVGSKAAMKALLSQSGAMRTEVLLVIKSISLYVLGSFLLWILLQGILWWIAYHMSGSKESLPHFLKWFTIKSAGVLIVFKLFLFFIIQVSISFVIAKSPIVSQDTLNVLTRGGFVGITFFAVIAFATSAKKWFTAYKNALENVNTWLAGMLLLVVYYGLYEVLFRALATNYWLFLILAVLIALPSFTISRIYLIKIVKR